MKIVKFKGGLGNQLFQYALLRLLELKYDCEDVKGDFSYYEDISNDSVRIPRIMKLNVNINETNNNELSKTCIFKNHGNPFSLDYKIKILFEIALNKKYYFENDRGYREIDKLLKYDYFDGYWQSWHYVNDIEDVLRKEIVMKNEFSSKAVETIETIKKENSVFLGIRRGDYIKSLKAKNHYDVFDLDYYKNAIEYINSHIQNPIFYIFSNDIDWVKQNMTFNGNVVFRNEDDQTSDLEELFIMASCKHAIIANSTYYWWGAWLIENNDKIVIAPKRWFADNKPIDIIPNNWVKI